MNTSSSIHFFAVIIICFKEIYSWNSFQSNIFVEALNPRHFGKRSIGNITATVTNSISTTAILENESTSTAPLLTTFENLSTPDTINNLETATLMSKTNSYLTSVMSVEEHNKTETESNDVLEKKSTNPIIISKVTMKTTTEISTTPISTEQDVNLITLSSSTLSMTAKSTINSEDTTETSINYNWSSTTEVPLKEENSSHYILITISVLGVLGLIGYTLYHFYRKEQIRRLRMQLMPVYNFDPTESDDWESNLLEEVSSLRPGSKKPTDAVSSPTSNTSEPLRQRSNYPVTYL